MHLGNKQYIFRMAFNCIGMFRLIDGVYGRVSIQIFCCILLGLENRCRLANEQAVP